MARFHHTAKLVKFPRSSLDDLTHGLLDTLEQFRFADGELLVGDDALTKVRLVEGDHLAAGARYRMEFSTPGGPGDSDDIGAVILEAHLQSWDRAGKTEADLTFTAEGHRVAMHLELQADNRRLHTVRVDGTYQGPGPLRTLQRAALKFEARLGDWWSAPPTARRGLFPVTLQVQHPLARASLRLGLGRAAGKRWNVKTMLEIRGRRLLRPVAATGLLVFRNRIRRPFLDALNKAAIEWNGAVPAITGGKSREALVFQHRATVAAVSRPWTEDYIMALHEAVEALQFVDGRLVREAESAMDIRLLQGMHATPGTRYRIDFAAESDAAEKPDSSPASTRREPLHLIVASWNPADRTRIEFEAPGDAYAGWADLRSARTPATIRGVLASQEAGDWGPLARFTCEGEADLEQWWAAVARSTRLGAGTPSITAAARHPLAEATLAITGARARNNRWTVDVTVRVEGRDWARPLVAAVAPWGAHWLERAFREAVVRTAKDWDHHVHQAAGKAPQHTADATLRALLEGKSE